jgi:hypothetical protein
MALLAGCSLLLHFDDKGTSSSADSNSDSGEVVSFEAGPDPDGDPNVGPDDANTSEDFVPPESGPSPPDTGSDAPVSVCAGKANGFQYKSGDPAARCCNQVAVDVSADGNCGACGIKCPSGFTCGQVVTGAWGCHCATDTSCVNAGYGTGATCYNDGTVTYCNCQCQTGSYTTCTNRCIEGAICHDVPGQNYCAYP